MIKVKVCCISNLEEAILAIKYGASAIGLVSEMPSGPGVISECLIKDIAKSIPAEIDTFLLTSKQSAEEIIRQVKYCEVNTVQIVDDLSNDSYEDLRIALPNIKLVQVIHVSNENSIEEAVRISNYVDCILLDSGNQKLKVKELGGTGRTHNWSISKRIVEEVNIPVYLAGGLNNKNVAEAINMVKAYGIDLCSGLRTNNKLDESKLAEFFTILKSI